MNTGGGADQGDPRDGTLGRVTGAAYSYLIVSVLLILTSAPSLLPLLFLDRSPANAVLAALCLLPVGPALSAALFAFNGLAEADGLIPGRLFWRGYRLNAADVLRPWTLALLFLAVIAVSLANLDEAGVPTGYAAVLIVIGALILLWSLHAVVITSLFNFRARDVARLAAYYLARLPLVTLGVASLVVLAAGIVLYFFDAVLVLLGGVWAALLLRNAAPMTRDVRTRFIRPEVGS